MIVSAQAISSVVKISTVYSQNEQFYLKSVPFDNRLPSLRGKTSVYKVGNETPLYVFDRGFDSVNRNNLILSDNGEVIFYVSTWGENEAVEELKSLTFYRNGKFVKGYSESEITGCDESKESCSLLYSNDREIIDREKSNYGTKNYKKVFKDGVDEKDRFLSDFPLFIVGNTVYLIDGKKKTHFFDLETGEYIGSDSFGNVYEKVKSDVKAGKVEVTRYDSPTSVNFPSLQTGKNTYQALADYLGMKPVEKYTTKDDQYKQYRFKVNANISQDGSLEIENIEFYDEFPKERISEFFNKNKFDSSFIPKIFDKWNLDDEYFTFRKKDNKLARKEKQQEIIEERKELQKKLIAEKINDVYIPKDLGEAFIELDRLLKEVDKEEMKALPKRDDMIKYHFGFGMWMRNDWGLWGGSRLQKYFLEHGVDHPDEMSSVILYYYYDWLNGKKETWKVWDKNALNKMPKK